MDFLKGLPIRVTRVTDLRDWSESRVVRVEGEREGHVVTLYCKLARSGADRELAVYRFAAGHPGFPAPPGFCVKDGDDEWLVLEKVEGERLADFRGSGHYLTAGRALASFHARAAGWLRDAGARPFMSAVEDLNALLPGLATVALAETRRRAGKGIHAGIDLPLLGEVEELTRGVWTKLVQEVRHLPATLILGDCHNGNLFLSDDGRLTLIDWSSAALGPGLLDLVALLDVAERMGDPTDPAAEVRRAYIDALPSNWRALYSDSARAWNLLRIVHALLELRWFAATGEDFGDRANRELMMLEMALDHFRHRQ
ncbi:MAG: aminoglycoside phosphotransferase family protein [Bacillota bacterium]